MKSMKKATPVKSISKSALAQALADATELKRSACASVLNSLAEIVTKEVKKTGKIIVPGITMLKTRVKPATKAGKKEIFGKVCMVQAKPAKTVIKAFPVAALKKSI